jgi:hypothetical protein
MKKEREMSTLTEQNRVSQLLLYLAQINNRQISEIVIQMYLKELKQFPDGLAEKALELAFCSGKFPSVDELRESVGLPPRNIPPEQRRAIAYADIETWIKEIKSAAWTNSIGGWSHDACAVARRAGITAREVYDNWNSDTENGFMARIRSAAKGYIAEKESETKQLSEHEKEMKQLAEDPLMR